MPLGFFAVAVAVCCCCSAVADAVVVVAVVAGALLYDWNLRGVIPQLNQSRTAIVDNCKHD